MKRCPECYEIYEAEERFCEADGHELLADPTPSLRIYDGAPTARPTHSVLWPAVALGVLFGVVVGAGIFAAASLWSASEGNERPSTSAVEVQEKAAPNRVVAASNPARTLEPEESPSPDSELEAEPEPSPATNTENSAVAVELNQGPISTGQKAKSTESEAAVQTVIEMNDGSTLDVDAAWEDKQGIWYRRSGLVSFVESSRVKAITARKGTKPAEVSTR